MNFYDPTTLQGLVQETWRLCDAEAVSGSDSTAYPRLAVTARINQALEELVGKIVSADGFWEWDDTNQTDLPIGTATLVEGQQEYTFASEYLKIKRMKVKDTGGNWILLKQIDQQDLESSELALEELYGETSGSPNKGTPIYYDIIGDSFKLYPAPTSTAVTLTSGLKVEFVRTAVLFTAVSTTAADTTAPGLPSPYHVLLAYKAALPYCMSYKKDRVPLYAAQIQKMEADLIKFYGQRNPDHRKIMTPKITSYI
jgi:hypothetical protein